MTKPKKSPAAVWLDLMCPLCPKVCSALADVPFCFNGEARQQPFVLTLMHGREIWGYNHMVNMQTRDEIVSQALAHNPIVNVGDVTTFYYHSEAGQGMWVYACTLSAP